MGNKKMRIRSILFIIFSITVTSVYAQIKNNSSEIDSIELNKEERQKVITKQYKILQQEKLEQRKELDGTIITDLSFEDIDGNKYTSQTLKGNVVVINFWFIQCKPCVEEFPDLNTLKAEFELKPVEFLAVSWNTTSDLEKFLKTKKFDFKVVPNGGSLIEKLKIPYYPYNVIIDQNGKIEYINDVLSFNVINKIKRKINKLL
jgi:peroxiredoxin